MLLFKKIKNYSEASVKNGWDPSILIITDSACGVNEISETIFPESAVFPEQKESFRTNEP